jgi:hypothetical protein
MCPSPTKPIVVPFACVAVIWVAPFDRDLLASRRFSLRHHLRVRTGHRDGAVELRFGVRGRRTGAIELADIAFQ